MVRINGRDEDVAGKKLSEYLEESDYQEGTNVVERNEEIVHKEDYASVLLKDGVMVEIVSFMGGGC